jgi:glutamyl-tRNA synthetase
MDPGEFADALVAYLESTGYFDGKDPQAPELARRTAPLVQRKLSRLSEYDRLAGWLFRPLEFDPEALGVLEADVKKSIQCIGGGLGRIEVLEEFTSDAIKDALSDQLHIQGLTAREFLEPQRIAVTGQPISTGIYESLELLGREESVARYRATLGRLAEAWQGGEA